MSEKVYFTTAGFRKYIDEVVKLEDELKKLYERLAYIAEVGGDQYHDNFTYEQQMMEIHMKDQHLSDKKAMLNNCEIFEPTSGAEHVCIGSKVTIERSEKEEVWEVVGFGESDPNNKKIAYNSPLAQVLMGKKEGDEVKFKDSIIYIELIE